MSKPEPAGRNRLSVGNIHLGAAAFAALVVSTVAAYLKWLYGVEVPPDVLVPTGTIVGTVAGWLFPSE
jgi:hypothetical protein